MTANIIKALLIPKNRMITQHRSKRRYTGSRYIKARDKRLFEASKEPVLTRLGEKQLKAERTKGGNIKTRTTNSDTANIFDLKAKQYKKAKIKTVVENPASKHFVRRNIMTKGTIIDTDLGKARVTNRPSQEGTINAVLIQ